MKITNRKATAEDIKFIIPIWHEFMDFLGEYNADYWQMKDGEPAFTLQLKNSITDAHYLVAITEVERTPEAFCLAHIEALPEWFGAEKIGLIRYLAVSKDHRHGGLGRGLVGYVLDWFHDNGIERVEVFVLKGIPASSFWDKLGFKVFMDRRFLEI